MDPLHACGQADGVPPHDVCHAGNHLARLRVLALVACARVVQRRRRACGDEDCSVLRQRSGGSVLRSAAPARGRRRIGRPWRAGAAEGAREGQAHSRSERRRFTGRVEPAGHAWRQRLSRHARQAAGHAARAHHLRRCPAPPRGLRSRRRQLDGHQDPVDDWRRGVERRGDGPDQRRLHCLQSAPQHARRS